MTRPRLTDEISPAAGLAAVALFVVLAALFLAAEFPAPAGFGEDPAITADIGYALLDLVGEAGLETEGFLFAFIAIAVVLDAALEGALLLARREDEGPEAVTDGGQPGGDGE